MPLLHARGCLSLRSRPDKLLTRKTCRSSLCFFMLRGQYANLKMPVVIIAGEEDKLIDIDSQSARLHSDVSHSVFHRLAGNGHMIQQTATDQVMSAIREVAGASTQLEAAE